jgi:hypothetical protein
MKLQENINLMKLFGLSICKMRLKKDRGKTQKLLTYVTLKTIILPNRRVVTEN